MPYFTAHSVAATIAEAEREATSAVRRFMEGARVEAVMAEQGVSEDEAWELVRRDEFERARATEARRRRRSEWRKAGAARLVAWVKAEGGGVTIDEDNARRVLRRLGSLRRPNAQTRRWVARRLYGCPEDLEAEAPERRDYEFLRRTREPMAGRIIAFIITDPERPIVAITERNAGRATASIPKQGERVVHNFPPGDPSRPYGDGGFRYWTQPDEDDPSRPPQVLCECGWEPNPHHTPDRKEP